ncbi:caspase family protein [Niastella sp. OAS944]|uniref:caspase family protein n=1 Tax=Niastella sp. OAS944 TaxID=2664089 RepID=UPI00347AA212|nr:hypothetical protein [Chitinophagaceae bacterium OAS944]
MPSIYALLVGINNYPVKPLQGCINDVVAFRDYLTTQYGNSSEIDLQIKTLTDDDTEKPTRKHLVNAFNFFDQAQNGDTCLFYYSGHGSFSPAPADLDNNGNINVQSFVCLDSRTPGGFDLVDKEMSFLIWKTLEGKPDLNFVAITDCCYSGTITKALIDDSGITERMVSGSNGHVPAAVNDYEGFSEIINNKRGYVESVVAGKKTYTVMQGKHLHLAASTDNQTSKELYIDGEKRGAFTHSLLKNLCTSGGQISYQDLIDKTAALVKNLVKDQSPDINVNGGLPGSEREKIFLSQETTVKSDSYFVYHDPKFSWCLKGGALQGITKGDVVLIETGKGLCETIVTASPTADISVIAPKPELEDTSKNYRATIERQPNQELKLSFATGFPDTLKLLLINAYKKSKPAFITIPVEGSGQYIIRCQNNNEVFITLPGCEQPVFTPEAVTNEQSAVDFLEKTERVSKWVHLYEFNNPGSSLTNQHYNIKLYRSVLANNYNSENFEQVDITQPANELYYKQFDSEWYKPLFRLKITNTSSFELYITSAYLQFSYGINTDFFEPITLSPGEDAWLEVRDEGLRDDVISMDIDDKYQKLGYNEITEYLKLFISTQKIDTHSLQQEGLDMPAQKTKNISNVTLKGPGSARKPGSQVPWKTETIGFTIIHPQSETDLLPGKSCSLGGVIIEPHSALQAKVLISGSQHITRSADGIIAPHAANGNSFLEPFDLIPNTRSGATMDVLELFDVNDRSVVTPDTPLIIQTAGLDAENVWPIGYDEKEKIYYLLGRMHDDGKIHIDTLPEETASDAAITQRSFTGSIKIYFQKIIGQKLGFSYSYPRLAIPTIQSDDTVTYESDTAEITKKVKNAGSILLFIHGIIGDTEGMAKCIQTSLDGNGALLKNKYDLILTFDYENLNTEIEKTAALLKECMEKVGLKEGHGKQLVIAAHSMGGLVSRVFIEQLNGNKIVTRLIMLGTPNNGTPWADVRDLAETLLTFAINGSACLKPWMFVISLAGKLAKGTQITLKQMDASTGIYSTLNTGKDPGIPYVIVAGNTQHIIVLYNETAGKIRKLFTKVKQRGLYTTLDAILFRKANDIAVTNESIIAIKGSESWKIKPVSVEVACDHMNYFTTLQAIQKLI